MLNTEYWNNEGAKKVFTHPVCSQWIKRVDTNAMILDLGCGYGRLTPDLKRLGFQNIFGYDTSDPLIERAVQDNPGATYTSNFSDLSSKSFDLVICFALFTSCPSCDEQNELISLINGSTHDASLLYISDYEIQDNMNYHNRYKQQKLDLYGCFASGNAIFRHHQSGHFDDLLANWRKIEERTLSGNSLNGNDVKVHQYLYVKEKS